MTEYVDTFKKAKELRDLLNRAKAVLGTGVVADYAAPINWKGAGDSPRKIAEQLNEYIKEHKLVIPMTDKYGIVSFKTIKPTKIMSKKLKVNKMIPSELANKFSKRVDKYMEAIQGTLKYDKESLRKIYDQVHKILFKCVREAVDKEIQKGLLLKCNLLELPEDGKQWKDFKEKKLCPTFTLDMEDKLKGFLFG